MAILFAATGQMEIAAPCTDFGKTHLLLLSWALLNFIVEILQLIAELDVNLVTASALPKYLLLVLAQRRWLLTEDLSRSSVNPEFPQCMLLSCPTVV